MFGFGRTSLKTLDTPNGISKLKKAIESAESIVIGAGAGLSTAAGFTYSGKRLMQYFGDFVDKYRFADMYSGGFYPYRTLEENWAFWSRYVFVNRYMDPPKPTYDTLYELVKDKEYFVLTTNVDHCFQKAGFAKERLYYTQGDYGLFQCSRPCHNKTYDNEEAITAMVKAQGFEIVDGELTAPALADGSTDFSKLTMTIPSELIPHCPVCGEPMSMNLRADDTFVQDQGWYEAEGRYEKFITKHQNDRLLFIELGTGFNTPGIIKYSFWRMVNELPDAIYACINFGEAAAPKEIANKSICINKDIDQVLKQIHQI